MSDRETDISKAVSILRSGGLVAFPTETVYGLGADALNSAAVEKIFLAKGRPGTNPLIAHVSDSEMAQRYAKTWPAEADWLTRRFWPGPLTIILPKQTRRQFRISDQATAGRETVGLRAPSHPIALELLRQFDRPIVAPSANRSNRISPTTAQHVRDELGEAPSMIIDGGPCTIGIESTVIDLTASTPTILRPGSITRDELEQEIGPIKLAPGLVIEGTSVTSPGQHAVHYAPQAKAYQFESLEREGIEAMFARDPNQPRAFLFFGDSPEEVAELDEQRTNPGGRHLMPNDPVKYARRLYAVMRHYDEEGVEALCIEMPPDTPDWLAVRDRLRRATRPLPPLT